MHTITLRAYSTRLSIGVLRRQLGSTTRNTNPLQLPPETASLLPLLKSINNVEIPSGPSRLYIFRDGTISSPHRDTFVPFYLHHPSGSSLPLGRLRPSVVDAFIEESSSCRRDGRLFGFSLQQVDPLSSVSANNTLSVSFATTGCASQRGDILGKLLLKWKEQGLFPDILRGWSGESCPVYSPLDTTREMRGDGMALTIERAALPLFAFPNFTAFLNGYTRDEKTHETRLWVPRRSLTKKTFPGMLDVTAGGCMTVGETAQGTIIREAAEEASLPPSYISSHLVPTSRIAFSHRNPAGWLLPGIYHCFDVRLPSNGSIAPKPNQADGEVSHFELLTAQECLDRLVAKEFKPSSALAVLDFLIRHQLFTRDTDRDYSSIIQELQMPIPVPMP